MKIKKLLKLQSVIEDSKIPVDMTDRVSHWSESKGQWINILDMDLFHVIRALSKTNNISKGKWKDKGIIEGQLSRIKNHVDNVRVLVNSIEEDIEDDR